MMIYFKRILSILVVVVVISTVFYLYLPQKQGIIETMNVTVGEDRVDVLCVGSSHMYCGINPVQLYREYGIAAYDMAVGSQAPWQSYYYIKEVCKTQHPKMIIFDTYMVGSVQDVEEHYQDYQTVANILNTSFSKNKIEAVMASKADSKVNILLRFPYTYDEIDGYTGFSLQKLYGVEDYSMGYSYRDEIEAYEDVVDVKGVKDSRTLHAKNERYLRRIIEYCLEQDIELILTNAPWPCITEEIQLYFNEIGEIADEYGITFINGCVYHEEMGIDYMTDSYGDGGHLNYSGVTKYTKWIGNYLNDKYALPDRRHDSNYEAYEKGGEWLDEKVATSGI